MEKEDNINHRPTQKIKGNNNVQVLGNVHIIKQYETFEPSRERGLAHCPRCTMVQAIDAIQCRHCGLGIREYWYEKFKYLTFMRRLAYTRRIINGLIFFSFLCCLPFILQNAFTNTLLKVETGFLLLFVLMFTLASVVKAKDKLESAMRKNIFFDQKDLANTKTDVMKPYEAEKAAAFGEVNHLQK